MIVIHENCRWTDSWALVRPLDHEVVQFKSDWPTWWYGTPFQNLKSSWAVPSSSRSPSFPAGDDASKFADEERQRGCFAMQLELARHLSFQLYSYDDGEAGRWLNWVVSLPPPAPSTTAIISRAFACQPHVHDANYRPYKKLRGATTRCYV